jgi:hypothetical protein
VSRSAVGRPVPTSPSSEPIFCHEAPAPRAAMTASATWRSLRARASAARSSRYSSTGAFIARVRFVVLEAFGELVGLVEDLLDGTGHGGHLRNLSSGGHGMDDELDPTIVADTDLQEPAIGRCADEHREVVKVEERGSGGGRRARCRRRGTRCLRALA